MVLSGCKDIIFNIYCKFFFWFWVQVAFRIFLAGGGGLAFFLQGEAQHPASVRALNPPENLFTDQGEDLVPALPPPGIYASDRIKR